jgi:hypothetical protein
VISISRNPRSILRFEPSSRTTLMGEQPNPWDLLQPQDVMSRHRTRITFFLNEKSFLRVYKVNRLQYKVK